MEEKVAIGLGTAMNALTVVDGAKQMNRSYRDTNNKYDNILGTSINKNTPSIMGASNKIIAQKTASEILDELYKEAGLMNSIKKNTGKIVNTIGKGINKLDVANTKNIKMTKESFKNKDIKNTLINAGKTAITSAPAVGAMGASGVGTTKFLQATDGFSKNKDNESKDARDTEYKMLGAGVTAAMLGSAIAGKNPYKAVGKAFKTAKGVTGKQSKKIIMDKIPGSKEFVREAKRVKNHMDMANREIPNLAKRMYRDFEKGTKHPKFNANKFKDKYVNDLKSDFIRDKVNSGLTRSQVEELWSKNESAIREKVDKAFEMLSNFNKKASDELNYLFEKHAGSKKDFAKKVIVENFFKKGLESIPYYLASSSLGYAMGRDMRRGLKKDKDINNDNQNNKIASYSMKNNKIKIKNAGKVAVEKAAEGLGRTLFPAAVTAITGRNIMDSLKKIDEPRKNTTQEDLANSIIININNTNNKRSIKRQVSKQLDEALSKSASENLDDIIMILRDKNELNKDKEKIQGNRIHVGNGIRKQFQMNDMNPLHPQM